MKIKLSVLLLKYLLYLCHRNQR